MVQVQQVDLPAVVEVITRLLHQVLLQNQKAANTLIWIKS